MLLFISLKSESNEYFSVVKRTNPSLYKYIFKGDKPVIKTYNRKSYFNPLIKWG